MHVRQFPMTRTKVGKTDIKVRSLKARAGRTSMIATPMSLRPPDQRLDRSQDRSGHCGEVTGGGVDARKLPQVGCVHTAPPVRLISFEQPTQDTDRRSKPLHTRRDGNIQVRRHRRMR